MKISTRGRYGMYAMLDLALHEGLGPIPAKEVAARQGISLTYLEQLLSKLKKGNFVKGIRGPGGGYQLNKPSNKILIGDIIRILEGPIAPVFCLPNSLSKKRCSKTNYCACFPLWKRLAEEIEGILDSATLADLKKDALALQGSRKVEHEFLFNI
jgi:Rrf2 family transcriptional regulator, cysteine metabolism repressor